MSKNSIFNIEYCLIFSFYVFGSKRRNLNHHVTALSITFLLLAIITGIFSIMDSGKNAFAQAVDNASQCDEIVNPNCSLQETPSSIPEVAAPPPGQLSTSGDPSYFNTSSDNSTLASGQNIGDLLQGMDTSQAESCCVTESSVNGVKLQTRIVTIKNTVPPNSFQAFGVPCDSDELLTGGGYLALESGLEIKGSQPFVGTNSLKSWMIAVKNNDSTEHQVEINAVCAKLMRPPEDILGSNP